jgi:hypothetical protein
LEDEQDQEAGEEASGDPGGVGGLVRLDDEFFGDQVQQGGGGERDDSGEGPGGKPTEEAGAEDGGDGEDRSGRRERTVVGSRGR